MFKSGTFVFCFKIYSQRWQDKRRIFRFFAFDLDFSGKALARTILTEIGNLILDINNCQRQGHDGPASVSGHFNGLPVYILRLNEEAL